MLNFLRNALGKKTTNVNNIRVQVAIEYQDSHWVLYVADPGTKNFKPVRITESSKTKPKHNDYGLEVGKLYPIRTFASFPETTAHIAESFPNAEIVKRPKPGMFSGGQH